MTEAPWDPRLFIARAKWTLSKTTADKPNWKHWYAVEAAHGDDPGFRAFCELIAEQGYRARFEGITYTYLRVDDHIYWAVPIVVRARAEPQPTPVGRRGGPARARAGPAARLTRPLPGGHGVERA